MTVKNNRRIPLELYVHIPFCVRKCQYCDFLSGPSDEETKDRYIEALLKEIRAAEHTEDYEIVSVFIGGGTPSALKAEAIASIMRTLQEKFFFCEDAEVTIEANPGTVDPEKLTIYRNVGINRLSLGLQSTDAEELKLLGRIHSYEEFLKSYEWAREAGFSNINIDLMFAIPGQTGEAWRQHLYQVAELNPEHISAYSLIIEEGTPFAEQNLDLPDEDTEYQMYEDTAEILERYGYRQYEISNYAKQGYMCRHNAGYWQRLEYLGFGLGASSLYGGMRFSNTHQMQEYLTDSRKPEQIRKDVTVLSRNEQIEEFMFLGLRMTEGISEKNFEENFNVRLMDIYGDILQKYEETGFMEHIETKWRLTRKGIHVSNHILADFLLDE
ncbi:oxygen-independent coproporphyrinogen III oxidase [Blautia sp. 2744]|uniref:Heme chaperone HemW n=1 Tax=Blautia intestinalis TaxID=2763028 RepID=A0ABR7I210_9FIRM|nr:radical SAM family heme chaperone HemW [Blautia intestinalis]MBC5740555.1 oxygen-independent coproporphyrinogen III oxidase [Blautia intestinalis]